MDTHGTIKELLEAVFSMQSMPKLYKENLGSQLDSWSNGLGVRQSSASNNVSRKGHCWDLLPSND
jgi:hypothetical protein